MLICVAICLSQPSRYLLLLINIGEYKAIAIIAGYVYISA